jgi:Leucine-rich repeat (LRR) protein
MADISAAALPALTELTLTNCFIRDLNRRQFASLDGVTSLNLTSNLITNMPEGVFTHLSSLRVLNLSRNSISDISNQWLRDIQNLQVLDMSYNNISNLEEDAFVSLSALQTLSLSENKISAVSPRMFNGLNSTLYWLDLSFNRISLLNGGVFGGLQGLRTLNLAGNDLQVLHGPCFNGLISLQQLDLSENNISSLENGVFNELNNLQRLNLSGNRLQALSDQCFCGLMHLQMLDGSRNRISSVSPGTFQSLGGLTDLILADNPVLGRMRQELMVLVGTGRRLQTVDVSRSGLTQVPAALTRSIRTLQLAGNSVTTVRCGDLDSYPLLQLLNLADNQIEQIEEDALGRLEVLSTLYLSGNHLHNVPRSLPSGLITLHLQYNRIQELNSSDLQGLPRLKFLSLRRSGLMVIQNGAFSQLTALETLDMSENPLKSLPGNALSGPLMTVLRLSHLDGIMTSASNATEMSFPVTSPERLEVLELDSSPVLAKQLLVDTAALAAFRQLRELNLFDTGLTNLRSDLFHFLPRLRTLRLNGNLWECDSMLWLANWIRQQQKHQQQQLENSLQDAYCASPPHLASRPVIHIHDEDFNITTTSTQPSTVFLMPAKSNAYEATTETRYEASVTTKMFSMFVTSNTEVPQNKTLFAPPPGDPLDNQPQQKVFAIHSELSTLPFNTNRNSTTTTFKTDEISPVDVTNTVGTTIQLGNSSNANNSFTIPSTFIESQEFLFNTTTVYEDNLTANISSTDSISVTSTPDFGDDFKTAQYVDIKSSETSSADEVSSNSSIPNTVSPTKSYTMSYPTDDNMEQNKVTFLTTPTLKSQFKVMNNSVQDDKNLLVTGEYATGEKEKLSCHVKNETTTQNHSTSSKNAINVTHTNTTRSGNRKIYTNVPSNSTNTLLSNRSWTHHKFFRNSKNKDLLLSTGHIQSTHNNLNLYKDVSNSKNNNTALKQTSSNKDTSKFKHYHDRFLNNVKQGDESLSSDSQENITRHNTSPLEASLYNNTSVKHTNDSSDLTNKSVHNNEFIYRNTNTNTTVNRFTSNSKIQVKTPPYSPVRDSVYRNRSITVRTGFHTNKLELVDRNNSKSLEKVASEHGYATSSGMKSGGNFTRINKIDGKSGNATERPTNVTTNLEGENLVFQNVTLGTVDKSVFYSSHASDAFASSVHVTVKEHISTSVFSGSHPSMFVLLGVGVAMAGAFVMAISHCAKRRRQAVEYSRQQDIEVRSMSSIGDMW